MKLWIEIEFFSSLTPESLKEKFYAEMIQHAEYVDFENEWYRNMRELKYTISGTKKEIVKKNKAILSILWRIDVSQWYISYYNSKQKTTSGVRGVHIHFFDTEDTPTTSKVIGFLYNNWKKILYNTKPWSLYYRIALQEMNRLLTSHCIWWHYLDESKKIGLQEESWCLRKYGIEFAQDNVKNNPIAERTLIIDWVIVQTKEVRLLDTTSLCMLDGLLNYKGESKTIFDVNSLFCFASKKNILKSCKVSLPFLYNKLHKMKNKHLVGVYWTLKKGESNHQFLENSKFVRKITLSFSSLTDCGFPRVKFSWSKVWNIVVEVYEVNDEVLAQLDRLEWVPTHYKRIKFEDIYLYEIVEDQEWIDKENLVLVKDNIYSRTAKNSFTL